MMNYNFVQLFVVLTALVSHSLSKPYKGIRYHAMAGVQQSTSSKVYPYDKSEDDKSYWLKKGVDILEEKLKLVERKGIAKNAILFLGDGMSVPNLAATRVYLGQQSNKPGEETVLSFEKFPHTGLSKTYCVDKQVADSACTATAYLTGVKGNYRTIGVSGKVKIKDCDAMNNKDNQPSSLGTWAQEAGKATGFVTTARVTHASPAGMFAHVAYRYWESDTDVASDNFDPNKCFDIARQLVTESPGNKLKVILGGGRQMLTPDNETDPEYPDIFGRRTDKINLIKQWLDDKKSLGAKASYVWNREEMLKLNDSEYILGLFEDSHMQYHLDANEEMEPTLSEMTELAINTLSKEPNGYFLFVEGGRIDMAHHEAKPKKAFDETVEFEKAVTKALELTNVEDTLIVVTSDHSHTMTMSGYADRGSELFTTLLASAIDGLPYSPINYANGPGYKTNRTNPESRYDLNHDKNKLTDKDYKFPGQFPLLWETHAGDDVAVFAVGPWAHLLTGTYEQNYIPHVIGYATRIGPTGNVSMSDSSAVVRYSHLSLLGCLLFTSHIY